MREAITQDIPDILRMGMAFCDSLDEECDPLSIVDTAMGMIEGDRATILVGMQGGRCSAMAGAIVVPHFFNKRRLIATELFWWVDEDARGSGLGIDLLKSVESWAEHMGAFRLSMVTMLQFDIGNLYEKHGFTKTESTWIKDL